MQARSVLAAAVLAVWAQAGASATDVPAAVLRVDYDRLLPVSRLDLPPDDLGFAGGALATADNDTTGQFTGQDYTLDTVATTPEAALDALAQLERAGHRYIVVLADRDDLLAIANAAGPETLIVNARAPDTDLRSGACRGNLLHVAPSRQMRADAVAQFLVWKQWTDWLLLTGSNPPDIALADAYRAAARSEPTS